MFQLWHLTAHFQQYLSTFPRLRKRGSVGKYQIGYCCNKPIFHLSQFPKSPKFKSDSLSAIVVMAVLHLREKGAIWRELARSCLKGRQTNLELKGFYKMSKLTKLTKTKTHIGGLGDTDNRFFLGGPPLTSDSRPRMRQSVCGTVVVWWGGGGCTCPPSHNTTQCETQWETVRSWISDGHRVILARACDKSKIMGCCLLTVPAWCIGRCCMMAV